MKTYMPCGTIAHRWCLVDAAEQQLGRVASFSAILLMGKDDPRYTPFLDLGSHVIIINAARVHFSGNKPSSKFYHRYTGYPGGLKSESLKDRFAHDPTGVVRDAILGMLPKTKLGRAMGKKLRVYRNENFVEAAQFPARVFPPAKLSNVAVGFQKDFGDALRVWVKSLTRDERQRVAIRTSARGYTPLEIEKEVLKGSELGKSLLRSFHKLSMEDPETQNNEVI